jgi:hypothetical protein
VSGPAHVAHMVAMGLLVGALSPALAMAVARLAPRLDRHAPPPVATFVAFVLLHAAVTIGGDRFGLLATAALLVGAVTFWMPVLGVHRRLGDGGRVLYLFLAMPMLDTAGVWMVAAGDSAGGLAMIVGMLPMAGIAMAITWRWITAEDRRVADRLARLDLREEAS